MKTPAEWLDQIKQASDSEVRHGSTVFLTEGDVRAIQVDALGTAENIASKWWYGKHAAENIAVIRNDLLENS